jgi:hypothetical protein
MDESPPFEENRRLLFSKRARELSDRVDALRSRVSRGGYNEADLAELASILRSLRNDIVGNDRRLSEAMGVSGPTIAQTYSGKSRPKYYNFMKMLYGAQQILAKEKETIGLYPYLKTLPIGRALSRTWGRRPSACALDQSGPISS